MEALREIAGSQRARTPLTSGRYDTRKTGEGRAFVVTFKHMLNGVEEPSLYARIGSLCCCLSLPPFCINAPPHLISFLACATISTQTPILPALSFA
jgi:hypothetical protein